MNLLRRALTLAAALTFASANAATPAFAVIGSHGPDDGCQPGAAVPASTARGGADGRGLVARERDLGQEVTEAPRWARAQAAAADDFEATVPVYFHVITDGQLGALSDGDIRAQIRVLNVTFGGGEGGFDSGFSFTLAGITRTDNARWFYLNGKGAEAEMKQALKQGGNDALNVYSNSGAGYLGWAYYPSIVDSSQAYLDGIVLHWESLPHVSDTFLDRYDEGETLTHEAGHWLNLAHTFDGGCNKGDGVADTPPQKTPTGGCPEGKDTCRAPGLDPIHNYMDYSYDDCYTEFTAGQAERMQAAWFAYRAP